MNPEADGPHGPPPYPFSSNGSRPDPRCREWQRVSPVARVRTNTGDHAWLVTGYEAARHVLTDDRLSHSLTTHPDVPKLDVPPIPATVANSMKRLEDSGLFAEFMRAISPSRCDWIRPCMAQLADELLRDMSAAGPPVDLLKEYLYPLPHFVACRQFGFPPVKDARYLRWSQVALSMSVHSPRQLEDNWNEYRAHVLHLIEAAVSGDRRQNTAGSVVERLTTANDALPRDDRLEPAELADVMGGLFMASHMTTVSVLALSLTTLLSTPGAWEQLSRTPEVPSAALEELLRHALWIHDALPRIATEDMEMAGVRIRAGDLVLTCVDAANRDPRVFTGPDTLDLTRSPNPHLAFGLGTNHCPGSAVARTVVRGTLTPLLLRFPRLRLAVEPAEISWRPDEQLRMPETLPVRW